MAVGNDKFYKPDEALQLKAESHSFRGGMDSLNRFRHEPNAIAKFLL